MTELWIPLNMNLLYLTWVEVYHSYRKKRNMHWFESNWYLKRKFPYKALEFYKMLQIVESIQNKYNLSKLHIWIFVFLYMHNVYACRFNCFWFSSYTSEYKMLYGAYKIEIHLETFISQTQSLSNICNWEKLDQPKFKFIINPCCVDSTTDLTNVWIRGNK